jgi:epoxyqueuosine reductase
MKTPETTLPTWTFSPRNCIEQPARSPSELGLRVKACLADLGLAAVGFTPAIEFSQARDALDSWLAAGLNGTMTYLEGTSRSDARGLLSQGLTLVVVAAHYQSEPTSSHRLPLLGQVARYAHGSDYHGSLRHALAALGQIIADQSGRTITARACVDTAPLLERESARRAGLGFIGKSNMLIVPGLGPGVLLGELIVDVEIASDTPQDERCGHCDACLRACPTQAFVGPWVLDARRCISYLTIEYKGWIPLELRPLIGTHVVGCDICQTVCPFSHAKRARANAAAGAAMETSHPSQSLALWLTLTSSGYRRLVAGTALRRTSRAQLLRNAAVAAGNARLDELVVPLRELLAKSKYPIVRGHAAWALGRLKSSDALQVLKVAATSESDQQVKEEINLARALSDKNR